MLQHDPVGKAVERCGQLTRLPKRLVEFAGSPHGESQDGRMKTNAALGFVVRVLLLGALASGCGGGRKTFGEDPLNARRVKARDLFALSFVTNRVGWAAGRAGKLVHTTDGGKSWDPQPSGVTKDLRALAMAITNDGSYAGIAVGDAGAFLRTSDGTTWSAVDVSMSETLRGAAASEKASLLLVTGDAGTLLRSEDLGASWTSISAGSANLHEVTLDAKGDEARAADDSGAIWESHDRARHFELVVAGDDAPTIVAQR
jgi:photosystem II stability/assembly factor-like uncharacterized protein